MKTKLIILATLCMMQFTAAQKYQTVEDVRDACATLGFTGTDDAIYAVERIMDLIGLPKNFTLQECPFIKNAVAKNIRNSSGVLVRYILYDNEFLERMDRQTKNDWAAISILAHEIGHHLSGHALNNVGSNHQFELEADYFSGMILARMGATLIEAQSAIQLVGNVKATRTHPAKADRLQKIKEGWNKGKGYTTTTVTEDVPAIVAYYLENANKGDAYAQSYLGYLYDSGKEIPQDFKKAMYWYTKAANQNDTYSQFYLAVMYYEGKGVAIDYYTASTWYYEAAVLGHIDSQYALAEMLFTGMEDPNGIEKDVNGALYWYIKAADQGGISALYTLGSLYYEGNEVAKDYYTAFSWYKKASLLGDADSQSFLGYMYETGTGILENKFSAIFWYQKAARQGNKYSQDNLTRLGETW